MAIIEHWSEDPIATVTDLLERRLGEALSRAKQISFMVSGGATPKKVLPLLARRSLDWNRIVVLASDERLVPVAHPDSTEGTVRSIFQEAGSALHYIGPGDRTGPEALAQMRDAIRVLPRPIAASFIGMGTDAHIASLFPGRPELEITDVALALAPETPPHAHPRLTHTFASLFDTEAFYLVVGDARKEGVYRRASGADAAPERASPLGRLFSNRGATINVVLHRF